MTYADSTYLSRHCSPTSKKRKAYRYAFWQFNEKPSIIPGCPGPTSTNAMRTLSHDNKEVQLISASSCLFLIIDNCTCATHQLASHQTNQFPKTTSLPAPCCRVLSTLVQSKICISLTHSSNFTTLRVIRNLHASWQPAFFSSHAF